jgi:hypothetical protein
MTTKTKTAAKKIEVSENERIDAAKKIVAHVFGGGTITQTLRVFRLIAEDAEETDLISLTSELVAVKTGLGESATFDQTLGVHHALVEDEDGMLLEDAEEIDEQIEEARATLVDAFGEEEAGKAENLATFLGA